jgi:hypothetical protein
MPNDEKFSAFRDAIIKESGNPWFPDKNLLTEVDTLDGFSLQFIYGATAQGLRDGVKKKYPNTKIHLSLFESEDINAFAAINPNDTKQYIIGYNRGYLRLIFEFFHMPNLANRIRDELPALNFFNDITISRFALLMGISYVSFHEFTHVTRGHLAYSHAKRQGNKVNEVSALKNSGKNSDRYLMECHADTIAGRSMAEVIADQSNSIKISYPAIDKLNITKDFVKISAFVIHSIFRIIESINPKRSDLYPVSIVRSAIVSVQLVEAFRDQYTLDFAAEMVAGLNLSKRLLEGLPGSNYDQEEELRKFARDDATRIDEFAKVLQPYWIN